jgi:hypothetical protein
MRKAVGSFCVLSLLFAASVHAQNRTFPDVQGTYTFKLEPDSLRPFGLDGAGREAAVATIERLNELFRATPVMTSPRGFDARVIGRALVNSHTCPGERCQASAVASHLWMLLYYFVEGVAGKPTTGDELNVAANVFTNAPGTTVTERHQLSYEGSTDPDGRTIYYEPRRTRTLGGFPMFDDDVVVITRNGRALWLPVTREAFLRAAIRDTQADIVKTGMPDSALAAGLRERVAHLRAELAALSPAACRTQAWHVAPESALESGLVAPGTAEARPLVVVNPDLLDRSLPRTAVQIITLRLNWGTYLDPQARSVDTIGSDDHVSIRRLWQLLNQADWTKLAAMVVQPGR